MIRSTLKGKSLTKEILFIAAAGPLILSSLFAPNAVQLLKPLIKWRKNWDKIRRHRVYEAIGRLNQKRLIRLIEKDNKMFIEITENGKKLVRDFDYDSLELPRPKIWDKKWHLVIFDIPDKKQRERQAFSLKLKNLGFYPLQKSVFAYPFNCRNEIDSICEFLSIEKYVNYSVVETIDKKRGELQHFFNLF